MTNPTMLAQDDFASATVLSLSCALLQAPIDQSIEHLDALRGWGRTAWPALPTLLHLAREAESQAVRERALRVLSTIPVFGDLVVPAVASLLQSEPSRELRLAMLEAIAAHPEQVPLALNALMELVEQEAPEDPVVEAALQVARFAGMALRPHLDLLLEHAELSRYPHRLAATACLLAMADPDGRWPGEVESFIRNRLESPRTSREMLMEILAGLERNGHGATDLSDALVAVAERESDGAPMALRILSHIGPSAAELGPRIAALVFELGPEQWGAANAVVALNAVSLELMSSLWLGDDQKLARLRANLTGNRGATAPPDGLVPAIETLLFIALRGVPSNRFAIGLELLLSHGALEAFARWLPRAPEPFPRMSGFQLHDSGVVSAIVRTDASVPVRALRTLVEWAPDLALPVATQLASRPDPSDEAIPVLLSWLSRYGSSRSEHAREPGLLAPVIDALTKAAVSRPWLRSLLLQRLATFGPDAPEQYVAGLAHRLAELPTS
jgi:hypothetical protein